ncbi:MAG: glycogen/starch synthase, partial [Planctomycetota bacterium]
MKVAFLSSEVAPFSKTGGLADVAGALPKHLQKAGCEISVITPFYREVAKKRFDIIPTGRTVTVNVRNAIVSAEILSGRLPDSNVPVFFIKQDKY